MTRAPEEKMQNNSRRRKTLEDICIIYVSGQGKLKDFHWDVTSGAAQNRSFILIILIV